MHERRSKRGPGLRTWPRGGCCGTRGRSGYLSPPLISRNMIARCKHLHTTYGKWRRAQMSRETRASRPREAPSTRASGNPAEHIVNCFDKSRTQRHCGTQARGRNGRRGLPTRPAEGDAETKGRIRVPHRLQSALTDARAPTREIRSGPPDFSPGRQRRGRTHYFKLRGGF